MSRYSERHQHTATCAHDGCEDPASKLEIRNGVLNWFCERHVQQ
ncbi:hypothetical protein PLEIONE_243 [Mycobacterium phage Pleione]|uniref:Uncharacterized protein n=1 Tax=Mycobacterium phage Pleione TaxID=1079895 RepID=G3M564_9CAUD|nr:hypothetical protein PLEIONE_243 [Mycobacterium phage Pleione]AEN79827.1 hypothetical protein PLEIONE_243 [Mycobacterium phage Pleione]